ncbi:class II glutamine amidotransferase [Geodermatophilus sp. SYSU D00691]
MCRLLGWASRVPTPLRDLLGEADLDAFTELSAKHAHGWGLARSTGAGVEVRKQADAARGNAEFAELARAGRADLGLAHLRRATLGLGIGLENTHPFTDGRVAFAHNGSIIPPRSVDRLIPWRLRRERRGDTDSERYFLAVLARMRDGLAPAEALLDTVGELAATGDFTSLNCLLLTPDELHAVCRVNHAASQEFDEGPDYYELRYRVTGDAVVVASSGWGRDWSALGNGDLLSVRRGTLEVSLRSLDDDGVLVA